MPHQWTLKIWVLLMTAYHIRGHGWIQDPPNRSSLWRLGYDTPPNYDDNSLFCGGFLVQYNEVNQGRCGECGDEWSIPRPRPNEEGGIYGSSGIIHRVVRQGELIDLTVNLTASHKGYFEFRLCKKDTAEELVTQECLDKNLLKLQDGSTRFYVPTFESGMHYPKVQLPAELICDFCVLQWHYYVGNSWGDCGNGTEAVGCGDQETFRNCADMAVLPTVLN